jgi:hypothetical protein
MKLLPEQTDLGARARSFLAVEFRSLVRWPAPPPPPPSHPSYARAARRAARVVAWKPVLIPATDRVDPHDEHVMKKSRLSLVRVVSGDLHVLHCYREGVSSESQTRAR